MKVHYDKYTGKIENGYFQNQNMSQELINSNKINNYFNLSPNKTCLSNNLTFLNNEKLNENIFNSFNESKDTINKIVDDLKQSMINYK
jgi:hypothetical protein